MDWMHSVPFCLSLLLMTIGSCKTSNQMQKTEIPQVRYELERTGCLGDCPVFKLIVFADRSIEIRPRRAMPIDQVHRDTLSETEFDRIVEVLSKPAFLSQDTMQDNKVVDAPFTIIRLYKEKKALTYSVRGDHSKIFSEATEALEHPARMRKWLSPKNKSSASARAELIIELNSAADIKLIEERFAQFDLVMRKKITPSQPYYLFDAEVPDHQKEQLLNLLKDDAVVIKVQWNHALKKRDQ